MFIEKYIFRKKLSEWEKREGAKHRKEANKRSFFFGMLQKQIAIYDARSCEKEIDIRRFLCVPWDDLRLKSKL